MTRFWKEINGTIFPADYNNGPESWTHLLIPQEEYRELLKKCNNYAAVCKRCDDLQQELFNAKEELRECKIDFRNEKLDLETKIYQIQRPQEEWDKKVEEARDEARYLRELNENLLRMNRERANAARGLRPKKEHTGYAVFLSEEKGRRIKDGTNWKDVTFWETRMQSPYSMEFTAEQARGQMMEDLENEGGIGLLEKLGIRKLYPKGFREMERDINWRTEQYNAAFELRLRANYRSGYWEGFLVHTKPLGIVPKEMQGAKRKNAPKGSEREAED